MQHEPLSDVAEARREQILRAAVDVFASRGFAASSIKDLAAAAGVSTALLYHYFDSKQAILAEIAQTRSLLPHIDGVLAGAEGLPAEEAVGRLARRFLAMLREREPMIRVLVVESRTSPEVGAVWRGIIAQASAKVGAQVAARVAAGELVPHQPEVLLRALVSPLVMAIVHDVDPEPWLDELVGILLRGVLARPAGDGA